MRPPWDLPFHRYLLTFSWKSLKTPLSAAPTSNPACGSAMWMIPLWYGHMAETPFKTLYNTSTSNTPLKFTMEVEEDGNIPFLDVGISRNPDGSVAPQRWHESHPHRPLPQPTLFPSPQHQVIGQPHPRTTHLRPDSLPKELRHIKITLQRNGYKPSKIKTSKHVPNTDKVNLTLSTSLTYLGSTSHKLQRTLQKAGVHVYHSAPNTLQGLLHTHKDKPDPSNRAGVYRIPCECGKVYIEETGQSPYET